MHMKILSLWLKSAQPVLAVLDAEGQTHVCPAKMCNILADAWEQVGVLEGPDMMDEMQRMEQGSQCRSVPGKPPSLQWEVLRDFVMNRGESASGGDRISLVYLRGLPQQAWRALSSILNAIEEEARWPWQLKQMIMIPIPKKEQVDVPDPLKLRLIAILSHVYRAWAGIRVQWLQAHWSDEVLPPQVKGGRRGVGSSDANTWDLSEIRGDKWSVAYLDATRCFDTFRFKDVAYFFERCGLDTQIVATLREFHEHQARFFMVDGWVSRSVNPQRGIPQGDPWSPVAACFWAMTWVQTCSAILRGADLTESFLVAFLDDFAVGCSDRRTLGRVLGATNEHFRSWGVQLNLKKSAISGNARASDHEGEDFLGEVQQADTQLYLGSEAGWKPVTQTFVQEGGQGAWSCSETSATPADPSG